MEPALRDGDWVVVRTARRTARVGELVVVPDPLRPERLLVKRVRSVGAAGVVVGSDAAHADHLAARGEIPVGDIVGRPVFRYAPLRRLGRVR